MTNLTYSSEKEWEVFIAAAEKEGIILEIPLGLPCSVTHPKACLRKATRALAFLKEGEAFEWIIRDPLCREHAEQASQIYHTDA